MTCDSLLPFSSRLDGDLDPLDDSKLVWFSNAIDLSPASSTEEFALQEAAARSQGFKLLMDVDDV